MIPEAPINERSIALTTGPRRVNLIRATIEALPLPSRSRAYYSDIRISGLQLVVSPRGARSWYLYRRTGPNRQPKRHYLGRYPDLTPDQARRKAEEWRGTIAAGGDPSAAKQAERARGVTVAEAFQAFCQVRGQRLKPRTLRDYQRFIEPAPRGGPAPFGDWHDRPLASLTKDQVGTRHRQLTDQRGPAQADHAMRFLRSLVNFARYHYEAADGTPLVAENPVLRLSQTKAWNRANRRSTFIAPHDLGAWFQGVEALRQGGEETQSALVADYLEFVILTGLRRTEAAMLRRSDVNLTGRILTVRDTKNHENHTLPLSDRLLEIVRRRLRVSMSEATGFIFPGEGALGHLVEPRRHIERVIARSGVTFSLHDLRRTFATVAESLDISAYALKRLLNHKMRSDVTAGYVIPQPERLRKPMQDITDFMLARAGLRHDTRMLATPLEQAS